MNFTEAMDLVESGRAVARKGWPRGERVFRSTCAVNALRHAHDGEYPYVPLFVDIRALDWYAVHDVAAPRYDFLTFLRLLKQLPTCYCGVRDVWPADNYGIQLSGLEALRRVTRGGVGGVRVELGLVDYLATDWYITDLTTGQGPTDEELRAARPIGTIVRMPTLDDYDPRLTWDNVREFLDAVANRRGAEGPVWEALRSYVHDDEEDEG